MSLFARNLLRILNPVVENTIARNIHGIETTCVRGVVERPDARTTCTLIPGDGVGPELTSAVQEVFKAAGIPVRFECYLLSEKNSASSAPLEDVIRSISKNGFCLKGSISSPEHSPSGESQTLNMKLRTALDLYANVVHVKALPGIKCKHNNIDFVIIREQTEGEYSALEHETVKGVVECLKIITSKKSERIARFAFDYATNNHRRKVTAIHKANIMKLGDGLFLKHCEEMAKLYPAIEFEKMIVDNCTMQIVTNPTQFDVMLTPNLYGNILDNISAGLVGGAGLVAGASYSSRCVIFEPGARHAYARACGKNIANPTAMLLCAAKLLRHVHLPQYGDMLKKAINCVLQEGKVRTPDIGGCYSTQEFTRAVIDKLQLPSHS